MLYRYYIDSSGGQSGSPVYILGTDFTDSITYSAVGIHVGRWDVSPMGFNVCVRLDATVQTMKDEKWPDWSKKQLKKPHAREKPGEGEQSTVLMRILLCVHLMRADLQLRASMCPLWHPEIMTKSFHPNFNLNDIMGSLWATGLESHEYDYSTTEQNLLEVYTCIHRID